MTDQLQRGAKGGERRASKSDGKLNDFAPISAFRDLQKGLHQRKAVNDVRSS